MSRTKIDLLIWPPLLIYSLYLLSKLIWFDSLSSFANDSAHYLVMARHFSPWVGESGAIASAWLLQDFPPLFPLLLALTGAAHSFLYAHLLVAALGLISLYFYYLLSHRWLNNRNWAILPIIVFAVSPGFLLGLQGILSESLYLMLTLMFFLYYLPAESKSRKQLAISGLLLAAILLTRTVGIALCFAILAHATLNSISKKKIQFHSFYVVAISLGIYFLLMTTLGPVKESHYFDILIPYLTGQSLSASGSGYTHYFSYVTQLSSMIENWSSFWLIFWTDEFSASFIATSVLLLASILGLAIRLFENKYDAWYVLFFILILFFWPHPGQMFRLFFPIMPLLLIFAGYAIFKLTEINSLRIRKNLIPTIFYLSLIAAILPSHQLIHIRANTAIESNMIPIYEIFRRADPKLANKELLVYNQMFKDFKTLENTVPADKKVMYFLPSYLAILSNRSGVASPSPIDKEKYLKIIKENDIQYIFLTWLHPRNSGLGYNGLRGSEQLEGWTTIQSCSQLSIGTVSCLFIID